MWRIKNSRYLKAHRKAANQTVRCRLLSIFMVCFLFFSAMAMTAVIIWRTYTNIKNLTGDHLLPTPWHHFPTNGMTNWDKFYSTPKLLDCTQALCLSWKGNPAPVFRTTKNSSSCPYFFQFIHQDLAPWRNSGISDQSIQEAKQFAAFRITIVNGRLYIQPYYKCVQTRMWVTVWGLLLLLERYPGMVPDLDLMFDCMDRPLIEVNEYKPNRRWPPPPLFRYCSDKNHYDIPFPDWSYWGWSELNIPPWDIQSHNIFRGSKNLRWEDRVKKAYWKGNPDVAAPVREKLLKCNATNGEDSTTVIYRQNWFAEAAEGYKNSDLSKQCNHRYKIYAEGHAWSVSFKYIVACGSTPLVIDTQFYDFFTRGLLPLAHYWPINRATMCHSIKTAVNWGNNHPEKAKSLGTSAQHFLENDLSMDHVYEYMFHLLKEYANLLQFKPEVPVGAIEVCKKTVLCLADEPQKSFLEKSLSHTRSVPYPCFLPIANQAETEEILKSFRKKESEGFQKTRKLDENS